MERVKVYAEKGTPVRKGIGMFARAFMEHFPLLPVEEEGRLHDVDLRENFIERIFTLKRWRELLDEKVNRAQIIDFHTRHKLLILSHSQKHYRLMGQLAASGKAIIFVSSYLPELLAVCDRVGVMARGRLREIRSVVDWTEEDVMACAIGTDV